VKLSAYDVYLNVAGGLADPGARRPDSGRRRRLVSSLVNAAAADDAVFFARFQLSGAVRPVAQTSARLKEAAKASARPRRAARIGPLAGTGRRCGLVSIPWGD
jgi:DNA repair protein RadA/Sms